MSEFRANLERHTADSTIRPRRKHPTGWEPGFEWNGLKGAVTVCQDGASEEPNWDFVIQELGLDPTQVKVVGNVNARSWDAFMGADNGWKKCYYYKADLALLNEEIDADYQKLVEEIKSHKKQKRVPPDGEFGLVVNLADWQVGKRDAKGVQGIIDRVMMLGDDLLDWVHLVRKYGVTLQSIYVVGMGDMIEGCSDHYPMQTFQVELDRRGQVNLARRLVVHLLKLWLPEFRVAVVATLPGNHPEHRKNGKSFTTWGDNDDLAIFDQIADAFAENPDRYGHVKFIIPDEEMSIALDVCGTIVGFAHGHQIRGSANDKVWKWWAGQSLGRTSVGDADVLVTAHLHHFAAIEQRTENEDETRVWLQCPSLDPGSEWFEHKTGSFTKSSTLTFIAGKGKWDFLRIL